MLPQSIKNAITALGRHSGQWVEFVTLIGALLATDRLILLSPLPLTASLVALVLLNVAQSASRRIASSRGLLAWQRWACLVACGASIAYVFCGWFRLPSAALWFGWFWLAFLLVWQAAGELIGWLGRLPYRRWSRTLIEMTAIRRDNLLLSDATFLGIGSYLGANFWPHFWPASWVPAVVISLWIIALIDLRWHRPQPFTVAAPQLVGMTVVLAVGLAVAFWAIGHPVGRFHVAVLAGTFLALLLHRAFVARSLGRQLSPGENFRMIALVLLAFWLMSGFARRTVHGGGDALWYAALLADSVEQARHGIFPIYVGQSEYQFNGAFYPMRVAPAFHHLGVLLDVLTMRTLAVVPLQNLLLTLLCVAGALSAYLTLGALIPGRRWIAWALAILFLSCPGVLGIAYIADLFMSWTTLPLLPIVFWAATRSFQDEGPAPMIVLAAALGATWWGHSPIALWTTLAVAILQAGRLCLRRPGSRGWWAIGFGALIFFLVAGYPLGSVLFYPPEPGVSASGFQAATPGNILYFLRQVMPATFLSLSGLARELSDFQLGYALWVLLALGWLGVIHTRAPVTALLLILASIFAILLNPTEKSGLALWSAVPGFIRNITGNWVMNRLYLVLALTIVYGVATAIARGAFQTGRARFWLGTFLLMSSGWSLHEAGKFSAGSRALARPDATAETQMRPGNVAITRFAYLVFPQMPANFTHGVAEPRLEFDLYDRNSGTLLIDNAAEALRTGRVIRTGILQRPDASGTRNAEFGPALPLEPGAQYLLQFDFLRPAETTQGVIQLAGSILFREYALPEFGGTRSFGVGGEHADWLPIATSSGIVEPVRLVFVPTQDSAAGPEPLARVRFLQYDSSRLPVQVTSWLPLRADVNSPSAAWLETPRMFQNAYRAKVNGVSAAVIKGPDGRARVAVPAGHSKVELRYRAPVGLQVLFWLSFATATALAMAGFTLYLWRTDRVAA